MTPRRADRLALLLATAAAAASVYLSAMVFEAIPHLEDEFAHLWQASVIAGEGRLWIESPPEPESFLVPFVVDHDGRRFAKYPPGWPAALALGVRLGAPQAVSAVLAALAVWWTYRLGARLTGRGPGLVAAGLIATSPMILMQSGSLMSHMLTVVLTLTWTCAWLELFASDASQRVPRWLLVAVAGLSLGLMALTRPLTALAVALPFAAHGGVLLGRGRLELRTLIIVALFAAGSAALLFVWQYAVSGDLLRNPYTLWWEYDRLGFGPGIGPVAGGHSLQLAVNNTRHSLNAWQHDLFGWPYLSWILLPIGLIALRRKAEAWLAFAVFPSLVMVYMTYWVGSWVLGPRYFVEAVPALAVVTAAGAAALAQTRLRRIVVAGLAAAVALNLLVYSPIRLGGLSGLYGMTRARLSLLDRPDLTSALIIVHAVPDWTSYGNLLMLTAPFRSEGALLLAYSRSPDQDRRAAAAFPDRDTFHYYTDDPMRLHLAPRPGD